MSIAFAKAAPFHESFMWVLRYALGGLAVAIVALSVAEPVAQTSTFPHQAPARASNDAWGSGPVTASLIETARNERPIPGVEPTIETVLASGAYGGFVPTPAASSSLASR